MGPKVSCPEELIMDKPGLVLAEKELKLHTEESKTQSHLAPAVWAARPIWLEEILQSPLVLPTVPSSHS